MYALSLWLCRNDARASLGFERRRNPLNNGRHIDSVGFDEPRMLTNGKDELHN